MATSPLDFDDLTTIAAEGGYTGLVALTNFSAAILLSWLYYLTFRENWLVAGLPPTDAEWDTIDALVSETEHQIMEAGVSAILPFVGAVIPSWALLCDGSAYLRVDYPELYAAIDPVFHIDADNFNVPNLNQRFPMGQGGLFPVGGTGGQRTVVLTEAEMPAHNHSYRHNLNLPIPSGGGAPIPTVNPTVTLINTGTTGGGNAHENRPPFLAVLYIIVSGR